MVAITLGPANLNFFDHIFCHARSNRYDSSITEYFVQTSDKVKITRADLDKWCSSKAAGENEAGRI